MNKKLGISNTSNFIHNTTGYTCYGLYYGNNIIYALMYQSNTKTGILKYFNTLNNDTLVGTYTFITSIVYNTMFITGSPLYYALGYGPTI